MVDLLRYKTVYDEGILTVDSQGDFGVRLEVAEAFLHFLAILVLLPVLVH